ncbi:gamma-glutamyl-gamma-aminobutyrate hydrolase family protein [Brevibacterium sediminis]|uniref:gamma-glutamyl-gamma-aminobutyrate hydrolase family protein n=1 Tax=Brevibacterium sediminis TaxID=1857024 RepID=UPI003B3A57B6
MNLNILTHDEVLRSAPAETADVEIAVVVQLNMPGQTEDSVDLQRDLTVTAVDDLHRLGARVSIHDVGGESAPDADAVTRADGILVLGGGDVDARLYGHTEPVPNEYGKDRRADDREIAIIRTAIAEDATLLALCRGSQLLNVACGGSLVPDLDPFDLHKGAPGQPLFIDETVALTPGSIIYDLYGQDELMVRNGHHQAVDRVGEGLRVAARAADGIVEATERIENTWILGVQWHPEENGADDRDRRILFSAFLDQVRTRKAAALMG